MPIEYHITPLSGHRYQILLNIEHHKNTLELYLPIWMPGSYTRRDYARHIHIQSIKCEGKELPIEMPALSKWRAKHKKAGKWQIHYQIYARDTNIRGNYLDDQRGIFNPCASCLAIKGQEENKHQIHWHLPTPWQIISTNKNHYQNYQHLIDSPYLLGKHLSCEQFIINNIPHHIHIAYPKAPKASPLLGAKLKKICQSAQKFMQHYPKKQKDYHFLIFPTGKEYGGIEHQNNTLIAIPEKDLKEQSDTLFHLLAHEYYHLWNIKTLRPKEYQQGYPLSQETPNNMLWLFEGFTSYIDTLLLLYSGTIDQETYIKQLSRTLSLSLKRPARHIQTLAQSSLEAWTKFYNGGESAYYLSSHYYIQGASAAWCIDSFLHQENTNLAEIMRALLKDKKIKQKGLTEKNFLRVAKAQIKNKQRKKAFQNLIHHLIHTTQPQPLAQSAQQLGLKLTYNNEKINEQTIKTEPGFRLDTENRITLNTLDNQAATIGIANQDQIQEIRPMHKNIIETLYFGKQGDILELTIERNQHTKHQYQITLQPPETNTITLKTDPKATKKSKNNHKKWLNPTFNK